MNRDTGIKILIGLVSLTLLNIVFWNGFETKRFSEYQLRQIGEAFQTAEYSETSCGLDFDGEFSCDTEYWSEPSSEVWVFTSDNGQLINSNIPKRSLSKDPIYLVYSLNGCPPKWTDVKRSNLDSYRRHQNYKYIVLLDKEYNINLGKFKKFSKYMQKSTPIEVDLWYFIVRDIKPAKI
jgi:hypothetical protein